MKGSPDCHCPLRLTASKKPINHKRHKRHKKRKLIKQANCNCKISNNLFLSQQNRKTRRNFAKKQLFREVFCFTN